MIDGKHQGFFFDQYTPTAEGEHCQSRDSAGPGLSAEEWDGCGMCL